MADITILYSIIGAIITLIICFIIGTFLPGIERKYVLARIQQRIGPIVTAPGIMAPIKFSFKENLRPNSPAPGLYKALPIVSFLAVLLILLFLTPQMYPAYLLASIIAIVGLLKVEEVSYVLMGSLSKSVMSLSLKFPDIVKGAAHTSGIVRSHLEDISSKRSLRMITYGSFPLYLALFVPVVSAKSLYLSDIIKYQMANGPLLFTTQGILAAIVFFIGSVIVLNESPFNIIEAEADVIQGPYMEYIAGYRSVIYLSKGLLMFTLSALFTILFLGIPLDLLSWNFIVFVVVALIFTLFIGILNAFTPIFTNKQFYPVVIASTLLGVLAIIIGILI